ncbi:conserved hypothetical protein [Gammaproteobacteria bacterium]
MSTVVKTGCVLKDKLIAFYKSKKNYTEFINIVDKKANYSLRIIEWFVSNYSKKYNIVYKIGNKDFNVYLSYKDQLKSYKKKQFDPFKRYDKFNFNIHDATIVTTIGQLNFFKWAISNNILDYVSKYLDKIKEDMNINIRHQIVNVPQPKLKQVENTKVAPRKKRQSLSACATRTTVKRYTKVVITFD